MRRVLRRVLRPLLERPEELPAPLPPPLPEAAPAPADSTSAAHAEILRFLLHETSALRRHVRHLIAENRHYRTLIEQTANSFDYQWQELPEGMHLESNPEFQKAACQYVCQFAQLGDGWFADRKVLDAGCGNGRYSLAMARLGARVTAIDLSANGIAHLQVAARAEDLDIHAFPHNVLQPIPLPEQSFDLVWSFGVLHHTGDTYTGFRNLCPLVRDGGYLFLMLYGEPRFDMPADFTELNNYERLRRAASNKPFEEILEVLKEDPVVTDLHGWFDAVAPTINDLYSFEEVEGWLVREGFADIRRTFPNRNLFIRARRG